MRDEVGRGLGAKLEELAPGLHAPPVEQALDDLHEPLGLAPEPVDALVERGLIAAGALHRLGEEPDARQRRPKLVAHLRDEVGLQLAQVRLAPEEDQHEHDARDGDQHEADRERAEEQVERAADEHEHDRRRAG